MWRVSRTIESPGESMSTMKTLKPPREPFSGIGRRHQLQEVGALGVRDEALVAVDDVVIALADGARAACGPGSLPASGSVCAKAADFSPRSSGWR